MQPGRVRPSRQHGSVERQLVDPAGLVHDLRFAADVAGTLAGDVLTNEVETAGGNFETAVNVRRVYVFTPTPTATPVEIPIANDDAASTNEDTAVVIDVMANDSNMRDLPMTVSIQAVPGFGSAAVLPGNTIRYTPNADRFGLDSFQYRLTDVDGDFDTAVVQVNVAPVNDVPNAVDDALFVWEDLAINLAVLSNDSGLGDTPLAVTILSGPLFGSASVVGSPGTPATIFIQYLSNANYNGPDLLTYQVCDPGHQVTGDGLLGTADDECDSAAINLTVQPVNDRPLAVADNGYEVTEDQVLDTALLPGPAPPNPSVLDNDVDIDSAILTAQFPAGPSNGTLTLRLDGTFVYTPRANFFGTDSFTYWAHDGLLFSAAPATVQITVLPDPADIPLANPDDFTISEDTPTQLNVLANDASWFDIPLTLERTLPAHGNAVIQYLDNTVIPPVIRILYTPQADWFGDDSFTYCARDVDGEPNNPCLPGDFATVDVHVLPGTRSAGRAGWPGRLQPSGRTGSLHWSWTSWPMICRATLRSIPRRCVSSAGRARPPGCRTTSQAAGSRLSTR